MITTPQTADHKPGDIVNGHRLTEQDGTLVWLPVEVEAKPKKKPKWPFIAIGAVAGVIVLSIAINGANSDEPKVETEPAAVAEAPAEAPKVVVPDVLGMTHAEAKAALESVGLELGGHPGDAPAGVATYYDFPATYGAGIEVEPGSMILVGFEVPKPAMTLSQENAIGSAESYLAMSGFSRTGLIEQLEYEEFSNADATFAVDTIAPDWNAEAAESAKAYLDMTAFSRGELYDQLVYEGFSDAEANAGLAAVGY